MSRIEEIQALGDKILNHWALTDTKQLGLQACEIAAQLLSELDRLTAENERLKAGLNAAVDDIASLLFHLKAFECDYCMHRKYNGDCKNKFLCVSPKCGGVPSGWKWGGIEPTESEGKK